MLDTLIYILSFIMVISLVVVIHEGGHFFVARWCGVKVTDFSIGFGKELWGRVDKHGTRWKICAIPMGGYVKMYGDEDAASAKSSAKKLPASEQKYTFAAQKLWKRASIIIAGPAMNYLSAIVILAGVLFFVGEIVIPPVVGKVMENSAAAEAGLEEGDRILRINRKRVEGYRDIVRAVQVEGYNKTLTLEIERDGVDMTIQAMPKVDEGSDVPKLGIVASNTYEIGQKNFGVFGAIGRAGVLTWEATADTLTYLGQILFRARSANDLRGPLGIAEASGDAMKGGFLSIILFVAYISIAVGFMNLLPIPVLDGGHLAFYVVEAIIGRPLSDRVQNAFLWGGMSLLLALMVFTLFLDIPRIISRMFP